MKTKLNEKDPKFSHLLGMTFTFKDIREMILFMITKLCMKEYEKDKENGFKNCNSLDYTLKVLEKMEEENCEIEKKQEKQFEIRICDEVLRICADEALVIDEDMLEFVKDRNVIARFKDWDNYFEIKYLRDK